MSHSASGRLKAAALDLEAATNDAENVWKDAKAESFRSQHIVPILRSSETAALAMDEIATLLARMKRECGPPREDIH